MWGGSPRGTPQPYITQEPRTLLPPPPTASPPHHRYQVAMLEEKLQHAEEGRARSAEATCVATARAAAAEAAMARTRGAEAFTALAEAEAEGQRLKAEVVRLAEVKRVLAREAAVTQQEASEAYLRCYTKCQAQVSAAKAAQAESRRAEAEAEKRLAAALTAAPSMRQVRVETELRRQVQTAYDRLQRQDQATEAVMAAAALTARVAARCMRERALAHAWGAWRQQWEHASWQQNRLLAASSSRLRLALRVAASFAAWRASWAKANEAGREKQHKAAGEALLATAISKAEGEVAAEGEANGALLATAISEREDLRRQLAALKADVAAERKAAAAEKRASSDQLTNACSKLLNACRSKEELPKEATDRTPSLCKRAARVDDDDDDVAPTSGDDGDIMAAPVRRGRGDTSGSVAADVDDSMPSRRESVAATPTWLRSAAVILHSPHAEAPVEPDKELELIAEERLLQVAPHPSRPQQPHAVSGAVAGAVAGRKLPHEMPLVQQIAAKAAAVAQARPQPPHVVSGAVLAGRKLPYETSLVQQAVAKAAAAAQAREQTGWQSPRMLRAAGAAPAGLPVTLHQVASYCSTQKEEEKKLSSMTTTTRFIVVEEAGANGLSARTCRRLETYEDANP